MAQVINASTNQIKLDNGKLVTAQNGGWYDGQQYWNGSIGAPGIGNNPNQTDIYQKQAPTFNAADAAYIQQRQQTYQPPVNNSAPSAPSAPTRGVSGGSVSGAGIGYTAPTVPNLPDIYKTLYSSSGIDKLEQSLYDKAQAYNKATSQINDNPYLSEATRVGRISKLSTDYNNNIKNDQDLLAMKKADIETQINLQSKQFDITSQAARDALSRFNTLLESGALDNASGDDIAQLTLATGLSSSAIQSAVNANKQKNVKTSVIEYDDGTNQGFAVVNTQTGEIISKQVVGASKPTKTGSGSTKAEEQQQNLANLTQSVKNGITLKSLIAAFYPALSKEDIYAIYNQYSPFGKAKETLAEVKQGKFGY